MKTDSNISMARWKIKGIAQQQRLWRARAKATETKKKVKQIETTTENK